MTKTTTLWVRPLGGEWQAIGVGTRHGIWAEDVELRARGGGPLSAAFTLRRDPVRVWPDLLPATPVIAEVAGLRVWKGRVADTPTRLGGGQDGVSVQCEGVGAHLEDDQYERTYVHTRMSEWKDMRSVITAPLTAAGGNLPAALGLASDGALTFSFPKGSQFPADSLVVAMLDLGEYSRAARVVVTYECTPSSPGAGYYLLVRGFSSPATYLTDYDSAVSVSSPTSGTVSGNVSGRRYVGIMFYSANSSTGLATEVALRVTSVQVFTDTAYESGDASALTADDVVLDAASKATMLLSTDLSGVEADSFIIPEFAMSEPRTAGQAMSAANVFVDNELAVDVWDRLIFRDHPTVPDVAVGSWSAMEFEDTSAGSLGEVFENVIVKGTAPDGSPVRVERTQGQQPGVIAEPVTSPSSSNPSFATNATGWTAGFSTITRDTATFDTTPASGRWDSTGASDALPVAATLDHPLTGTFLAGETYLFDVRIKMAGGASAVLELFAQNTVTGEYVSTLIAPSGSFATYRLTWTPRADATSVTFSLACRANVGNHFWIDSLTIGTARVTIVARQGFRRTHVLDAGFTLTDASAAQLGDKFLQAHKVTPFAGRLKLVGPGAARDYSTGIDVHPERLLLMSGGLAHFSDRADPDTGAWGRDGRMVETAYFPERDEATAEIDSSRSDFDTLLQRVGVNVAQIT